MPDEIWIALEIANEGALDSVTVLVTPVDRATVKLEEGVTVKADEITVEAVMADDRVTVLAPAVVERPTIQLPVWVAFTEKAEDGVTVKADEITVEAVIAEDNVTVLAPALVVSDVTHGEVT